MASSSIQCRIQFRTQAGTYLFTQCHLSCYIYIAFEASSLEFHDVKGHMQFNKLQHEHQP